MSGSRKSLDLCKTRPLACPQAPHLATQTKARAPGGPWVKAEMYLLLHSAERLTIGGLGLLTSMVFS